MERIPIWVLFILIFFIIPKGNSVEEDVKKGLVQFLSKLSPSNASTASNLGWNISSDPCKNGWVGVECDIGLKNVKRIVLEDLNLTGYVDANSLCLSKSLVVLSLQRNNISGLIPEEIEKCRSLTHMYLTRNNFSGSLPMSFSRLSNLKKLFLANNKFRGELPELSRISGLVSFLAENNHFSGEIPNFDFSNFVDFNVSNNNFSGPIPDVNDHFQANSFLGNPYLCGKPLGKACPPPPKQKQNKSSTKQVLIYSGYVLLALIVLLFIVLKLVRRKKTKEDEPKPDVKKKPVAAAVDESSTNMYNSTTNSSEHKNCRSEYSITSMESARVPPSLVVLASPVVMGLTFEELLKAPAELLGRGKHGSLYKVMLDNGVMLAVKRIKDWEISTEDFNARMKRIDQVKHPNVLPQVAFYCARQEKLLVYEYQQNGSLFKLLHGSQSGQVFDWGSRLVVAASIAEAMAFMHEELQEDGIAHGNLKSINILFTKTMDPCISEYGLMVVENQDQSLISPVHSIKNEDFDGNIPYSPFKIDIYAFGVIILELLTGKLVQKNGFDLPKWVQSVVREEWTVEVFDKALISEGANEERMVNLLQVALSCINPSPNERPSMSQVSQMINTIKEEEEKSISFAP
ncbi:hypothetical protein UlMin_008030 [Ulmus minor]